MCVLLCMYVCMYVYILYYMYVHTYACILSTCGCMIYLHTISDPMSDNVIRK